MHALCFRANNSRGSPVRERAADEDRKTTSKRKSDTSLPFRRELDGKRNEPKARM
jgi:hypothetical protein